jgi:hypothetical protein
MRKVAQLVATAAVLAAVSVPAAQADRVNPRELQASACSSVKVGGKGHVLYRRGVRCTFAKRWARRLAASRGDRKPRGYSCSSGSKFRGGGYCEKGSKHFGWYRGE